MGNQAVINQLNKRLNTLFDTDGEVYKILVSGGSSNDNPDTLPDSFADLNQGAIANLIQYNRNLTDSMLDQTDLNQAEGDLLDYLGSYLYNIFRDYEENESGDYALEEDDVYRARIKERLFGEKESPISILRSVSDDQAEGFPSFFYKEGEEEKINSNGYPFIKEGEDVLALSAFADQSYAGVYQQLEVEDEQVFPAICGGGDFDGIERFYFRVYMMLEKPQILKDYEEALQNYENGIISEEPEKTEAITKKEEQYAEKQLKIADKINYMKAAGVDFQVFFLEEDLYGRNSYSLDVELSKSFSSEEPYSLDLTFSALSDLGTSLEKYVFTFLKEEESEITTLTIPVLTEDQTLTLDQDNLVLEDNLSLFSEAPSFSVASVSEETEAFMLNFTLNQVEDEESLIISAKVIF